MKAANISSQSNLINVNFSNDPSYRYKMEKPMTSQSGGNRGKGKFTTILNIYNIAQNIHRDAGEIARYMSKRFSVGLVQKDSTSYSFTGHISNEVILNTLKQYIFRYVLCQNKNCKNPETEYVIEHNKLCLKCASCGQVTPVPEQASPFTKSIVKQLLEPKEKQSKLNINDIKKQIKELIDQKENTDKLGIYIENLCEDGQILTEEVPIAILSTLKIKEMEDFNTLVNVINKYYSKIEKRFKPDFVYVLYTLEIIYYKNKQIFAQQEDLLNNIFYSIYDEKYQQSFLHYHDCSFEETFVTEEIHNECLQQVQLFYDKLNQIDNGEEEEEEEYYESEPEVEILIFKIHSIPYKEKSDVDVELQIQKANKYTEKNNIVLEMYRQQNFSLDAIQLLSQVQLMSPLDITLWTYRLQILQKNNENIQFVNQELQFINKALKINAKIYPLWDYRREVIQILYKNDNKILKQEKELVLKLLQQDGRNYHVHNYVTWINQIYKCQLLDKSDVLDLLNIDFSNYSIMNYAIKNNINIKDFVKEALLISPNDESLLTYFRHEMKPEDIDFIIELIEAEEPQLPLCVTDQDTKKLLQLVEDNKYYKQLVQEL